MARVTVEDCIRNVPNPFELVLVAAQRSRQLTAGALMTVDRDNDRNPVVSLREIAKGTVDVEKLKDALLVSYRKPQSSEVSEEVAAYLAEETQVLPDFSAELSLTGEIDEEEAALDAEFSEIERNVIEQAAGAEDL